MIAYWLNKLADVLEDEIQKWSDASVNGRVEDAVGIHQADPMVREILGIVVKALRRVYKEANQ